MVEYIRSSKIRVLFSAEDPTKDTLVKIRIASSAVPDVLQYLDDLVVAGVGQLIEMLPRKSKGDRKGELKRITIAQKDVVAAREVLGL